MLGVVNGLGRIRRRRPTEPGSSCRFRPSCKLGKVGKPAFGGPDGLQSIEGRHAWPSLVEIETRIGEADPPFGRASRKRQGKELTCLLKAAEKAGICLDHSTINKSSNPRIVRVCSANKGSS